MAYFVAASSVGRFMQSLGISRCDFTALLDRDRNT
jgi:hypothetical protein